jgi:uncharacterized RDD family membrane protein YckC
MKIKKEKRILNFIIDSVIIGFFINLIIYLVYYNIDQKSIEFTKSERKIFFLFFLTLYYFLSEYYFGTTVGKYFTKTKVVNLENNRPKFYQIFIRSITRLIPIDLFTYFTTNERGLHDILSKTKLISTK